MACKQHSRWLFSLVLVGALVGCGGGGGGGSDDDDDDGGTVPPPALFALGGIIDPAGGNATDSDVNDPTAPYAPNDNPTVAQLIPNPVTLGGYANQPGSGAAGRSRLEGDIVDWYQVTLAAGQVINLAIAEDGQLNDLDMGLFDANGELLQASVSQVRFETLTVPADGNYFIVIEAFRGASNYILSLGQQQPVASTTLTLDSDFVPGEIVVRFSDAAATSLKADAAPLGLVAKGGAAERNRLLSIENTASATLQSLAVTAGAAGIQASDPVMQLKLDTLRTVKALRLRDDVAAAAPNYYRQALFVPNDAQYPLQWHYPQLNLPQAWDYSTGSNTVIAVIDTGILGTHPDLQPQVIAGYDFISQSFNSGDGDGIDADATDVGDRANPDGSSSFHGSHVAGTAAAATHNSIGVAGVAFGARIMPLRVLGQLGGTDFDIEQAVRYAAGLPNDSDTLPLRKADVINLSLGGPDFSETSQAVFAEARAAGVAVVAAAGNERSSQPSYPAAYPGVIAVSAVTITKELAPYSNFGSYIDVAAPGGNTGRDINGDGHPDGVLSTIGDDGEGTITASYTFYQGTSMAAPHLAGVIALMRSVNPSLTPQDIDNLLAGGLITEDLGDSGRDDRFGFGLINALQAVIAASNAAGGTPIPPVPILSVAPAALNFGTNLNTLTLTVSNGGDGELVVQPPVTDAPWLSVTAPTSGGLGTYTLTVDRSNLQAGLYTTTLTFASNANTVSVPVIVQVAPALSERSDAGQQYVVLFDPELGETVDSAAASRQLDGRYTFTLNEIPAGRYELYAGTDADNDLLICDDGEACGAFLTLDQPILIDLNSNRSDLEFVSGYTADLANLQPATADSSPGLALTPARGLAR